MSTPRSPRDRREPSLGAPDTPSMTTVVAPAPRPLIPSSSPRPTSRRVATTRTIPSSLLASPPVTAPVLLVSEPTLSAYAPPLADSEAAAPQSASSPALSQPATEPAPSQPASEPAPLQPATEPIPARLTAAPAPAQSPYAPTRPAANRRGARPLTVQTEGLGPVRVRRITLGGVAASADRLRSLPDPDGAALVDALIAQATTREGAPLDSHALDGLSEQDRRAIATAMLTLEGIKAGGEESPEDPRAMLARRYHEIVGTSPSVPAAHDSSDEPEADATVGLGVSGQRAHDFAGATRPGDSPGIAPTSTLPAADDPTQIALFEPPAVAPRPAPEPVRPASAVRATVVTDKLSARVDDLVRRVEPLETGENTRQALMSASATMDRRVNAVETSARRLRWAAGIALAAVLLASAAMTWVMTSKLSTTRAALAEVQARADRQDRTIEELKRSAGARPTGVAEAPRAAKKKDAPRAGKSSNR